MYKSQSKGKRRLMSQLSGQAGRKGVSFSPPATLHSIQAWGGQSALRSSLTPMLTSFRNVLPDTRGNNV